MRRHRYVMTPYVLGLIALLCFTTAAWSAQIRVATYNIQFLSTEVVNQGDRLHKLHEVITFVFGEDGPPPPRLAAARILALLPNPDGPDEGREQVTLSNGTAEEVNLTGRVLRDSARNRFTLTGSVPAQQPLTITMLEFSMPLNNSGDDVSLIDLQGRLWHHVRYTAAQAPSGQVVTFE